MVIAVCYYLGQQFFRSHLPVISGASRMAGHALSCQQFFRLCRSQIHIATRGYQVKCLARMGRNKIPNGKRLLFSHQWVVPIQISGVEQMLHEYFQVIHFKGLENRRFSPIQILIPNHFQRILKL